MQWIRPTEILHFLTVSQSHTHILYTQSNEIANQTLSFFRWNRCTKSLRVENRLRVLTLFASKSMQMKNVTKPNVFKECICIMLRMVGTPIRRSGPAMDEQIESNRRRWAWEIEAKDEPKSMFSHLRFFASSFWLNRRRWSSKTKFVCLWEQAKIKGCPPGTTNINIIHSQKLTGERINSKSSLNSSMMHNFPTAPEMLHSPPCSSLSLSLPSDFVVHIFKGKRWLCI